MRTKSAQLGPTVLAQEKGLFEVGATKKNIEERPIFVMLFGSFNSAPTTTSDIVPSPVGPAINLDIEVVKNMSVTSVRR